jgi:hypothetical protein
MNNEENETWYEMESKATTMTDKTVPLPQSGEAA